MDTTVKVILDMYAEKFSWCNSRSGRHRYRLAGWI